MDRTGFQKLLEERGLSAGEIEHHFSVVDDFEGFLKASDPRGWDKPPTAQDLRAYSQHLIDRGLNSYASYLALARYAHLVGNHDVYVAVVELVDGREALENLRDKVGAALGDLVRDEIFEGIELPPLGTPSTGKPAITQVVMERLESRVDAQTCREILGGSLRDLQDERFLGEKERYEECASFDEYLEAKGQRFLAELEKIKSEGGLYFTQEITDEVLAFVRSQREISHGVRDGNTLYEVKIPYMTAEYLAETDEGLKRYYYCHCPWVRESLMAGDVQVSPTFCTCSAGFHKKAWEVIFGRALQAEIVESVLLGDPWCKIAIQLPEEIPAEPGGIG